MILFFNFCLNQTKARRYCIQEDDALDKHVQIRNMDTIYANAFWTIVAAAGDNSDYGLPGVFRRAEAVEMVPQESITRRIIRLS